MICSDQKRAANRANAQHSTGPRTPAGKTRSAQNATTHGGYQTLVLPSESEPEFHLLRVSTVAGLAPQTALELRLCDRAAALLWRLHRLQTAETGLLLEAEQSVQDKAEQYVARYYAQPPEHRDPALAPPDDLDLDTLLPRGFSTADLFKRPDNPLDRLTRAEHRLQGMLNSTLRQLQALRKTRDAAAAGPAPVSPYLADVIASAPLPTDDDIDDDDSNGNNEAEAGGNGNGNGDEGDANANASNDDDRAEDAGHAPPADPPPPSPKAANASAPPSASPPVGEGRGEGSSGSTPRPPSQEKLRNEPTAPARRALHQPATRAAGDLLPPPRTP
jgi:hypothetical protein